ncbi:MAG: CdaR family protein [Bacillota bacterium]|nr:CdaR family protein [Bacillota bacterium]
MSKFWRQEDLWLKIVSLLVALVIWVYAASRTTPPPEVGWRMSVPLEVRGVPAGLSVTGLPPTIEVSLVAAPGQESQVKERVRAILSLSGLGPGRHRVAVRVPQPSGGRVVGVSPRWIEVELGRTGTRQERVAVELAGEPASGFRAGPPRVTPPEVRLRGLESLLARVAGARAKVEVGGAASEVRMTVVATPVDVEGKPVDVEVEPAEVEVLVPIDAAGPSEGASRSEGGEGRGKGGPESP